MHEFKNKILNAIQNEEFEEDKELQNDDLTVEELIGYKQLQIINIDEFIKPLVIEYLISKSDVSVKSLERIILDHVKNALRLKRELYQVNPALVSDIYGKK